MIYPHGKIGTLLFENTDQFYQMSASTEVRSFDKISVGEYVRTPQVYKVSAGSVAARQRGYIVVESGTQRTGTESESVARTVYRLQDPVYVFL